MIRFSKIWWAIGKRELSATPQVCHRWVWCLRTRNCGAEFCCPETYGPTNESSEIITQVPSFWVEKSLEYE